MTIKKSATKSPIGITMGCPAGIGPEIIVKALGTESSGDLPESIVLGDVKLLARTAESLGISTSFCHWKPGNPPVENAINVLDIQAMNSSSVTPGRPGAETGAASAAYIERAIDLCLDGTLSAVTTCPISKAALNQAGYDYPGHTEFLLDRTKSAQAIMMMAGKKLNIILATIHCSLRSVPDLLSTADLEKLIEATCNALMIDFAIDHPKIAVAGLNPHSSEDGLFGNEEQVIITPAIDRSSKKGINVRGPFPPDTVFFNAASGLFDAVICMYHDQGLIPFKLLHFEDGVNVTLGLPIIRTSVDHGTAYDIAGTGIASHLSLTAAVSMAAMIAENRQRIRT